MIDQADKDRLATLEQRIDAAKKAEKPTSKMEDHHSQAHLAWRMVVELVTGLLIGFGIGYGLDVLFGTLPLFLVLFILVGFAAGVRVMLRTATEVQKDKMAEAAGKTRNAGSAGGDERRD